ncbi:uncharacterized protein TNCV_1834371 [Trichonephila clavipes]|nr:uncharacterized protein TNCV_1834371 [Trichonephila clavipes]
MDVSTCVFLKAIWLAKMLIEAQGDTSVLGVIWNLETDTLKCCTDMDTLTCETKITRRLILVIVPEKFFDPIGLLTPATLLPKLLIQHLWKMKIHNLENSGQWCTS